MEVNWLAVELELWPPAYTTATAMPDPSCVCNLHHSSWQRQILNPLSEARDQICILMDTRRVLNLLSHSGNSLKWAIFIVRQKSWLLPWKEEREEYCSGEVWLLASPQDGKLLCPVPHRGGHLATWSVTTEFWRRCMKWMNRQCLDTQSHSEVLGGVGGHLESRLGRLY